MVGTAKGTYHFLNAAEVLGNSGYFSRLQCQNGGD